ncbi:UPF0561 protein C2orf68 homolog [Trichechus manatus latirostris]|uniref:UPF0561 protein C2orf68 homolog n=1 Tax=Trichechus manatus latirostris TaxID=127582 RepID=A0A2Y9E860_TRIMA|nr:UPF0561 protein C2orf68 homolog [Trichechus manatus latirostris]
MLQRKQKSRPAAGSPSSPPLCPTPASIQRAKPSAPPGPPGTGSHDAVPEVERRERRILSDGRAAVGAVETAAPLRTRLQMEAAPDPGPGLCCKPGGRLDMSHGFVHHIRRNQIARDDYDKKVKQAAKEKVRRRHTPAPTRPRKPDLQVYLPRRRDGSTHPSNPEYEESGDSNSSGGSELEPSGHQLFCLEYEADSGEVTSVIVYQDDDPGRVSEEVSAHTPLDPPMREALKLRVQEEIAKRRNRH